MRKIMPVVVIALGVGIASPTLAGPPGGVPPGLAKKGVDRHEWHAHRNGPGDRHRDRGHAHWRHGERLPDGRYVVIRDYDRYGMRPPRRGESYYVVDGQVLRVIDATREVAEALGAVTSLLD